MSPEALPATRAPKIRTRLWSVASFLWLRFACLRLRVRLKYHGVPGEDQAVLIAGKHASAHDIVLLGVLSYRRTGRRPYFQMGSFIGYRVFSRMKPLMRWAGGFEVMRPKEVRRLARMKGWDRDSALQRMREVNDRAEAIRQAVLRDEGVLAVFPEGTRDGLRIRPLVSELEIRSALAVAADGQPIAVWPVSVALSRRRGLRRRLRLDFLEPFALDASASPADVLRRIEEAWRSAWLDPEALEDSP